MSSNQMIVRTHADNQQQQQQQQQQQYEKSWGKNKTINLRKDSHDFFRRRLL